VKPETLKRRNIAQIASSERRDHHGYARVSRPGITAMCNLPRQQQRTDRDEKEKKKSLKKKGSEI
jgi:hypothetical protein